MNFVQERKRNPLKKPSSYVYPGTTSLFGIGAQSVVESILIEHGCPPPVLIGVNCIISRVFDRNVETLRERNRMDTSVFPRQVGMMLLWLSKFSLSEIGGHYARDHATVLHAIRRKCFPILETKYPRYDYDKLVSAISSFHILYPQLDLSGLPGGWNG